ncbi:MAG: hypothetical protein HKN21_04580, partial [Candidatus Eisenbacteria bacterium]|nr:hypothetical protein [Candidatus Eisenbacteria bacterium]
MIDTKILLNTLLHLLPVLYGIAFFNYILVFVTEEVLVRRVARPLVSIAVAVNAVYMLGFTIFFQHVPFVTVFQMLGAVAFSMAAIYLWVETKTESPYT